MASTTERPMYLEPAAHRGQMVNVNDTERWLSVLGGGALAMYGLTRRDAPGAVLAVAGGALLFRGATGHCHVYSSLGLDSTRGNPWLAKRHGPAAVLDASDSVKVERAVTILAEASDLYRFWRNFENLPRVMRHLESVTVLSPTRSRWKTKGPAGQSLEWEAEIINEKPNELIAWKSVDEATVPNAGSVHFSPAPGERGTQVRVELEYAPPAGKLGALVAKLFGEDADMQVREDLRAFKQVIEAGATPTTDGQPSGRR